MFSISDPTRRSLSFPFLQVQPVRTAGGGATRHRAWFVPALIAAVVVTALAPRAWSVDLPSNVEERVKRATLYVLTFRSEQSKADRGIGTGSGFFINRTGLAITNNHVVDPTHGKNPVEKHMENYQGGKLTWKVVVNSGVKS